MNAEQLTEVMRKHALWLHGKEGGEQADLSVANLRGANLRGANLSVADLSVADLSRADLSRANLRGANLSGANLSVADLSRANLRGANLSEADLSRANLSGADLRGSYCAKYASASWSGHGECGRQLLAIRVKCEDAYFCGCFRGTAKELQHYIDAGDDQHKASRQRVFDFVRGCMEATP